MNKQIWLVIILAIIIIILAVVLLWPVSKKNNQTINNQPTVPDIEITMPKANDWVSSPLEITGVVNGNGWSGFEGQVGTVKLVDANNEELVNGVLGATSDWTKLPTNFQTNLMFNPGTSETGSLVFRNENPSGDPAKDKIFMLPVKFALGK